MKNYRLTIKPESPFLTPFDSDSLFGAVCWVIRWHKGEQELEEFLASYRKSPPLLISNGFRHEFLPFPVLPPLTKDQTRNIIEKEYGKITPEKYKNSMDTFKAINKVSEISLEVFSKYINNFSLEYLMADVFSGKLDKELRKDQNKLKEKNYKQKREMYHNQINRLTGTVNEEGLFTETEREYYTPVDIYVRTDEVDYFRDIFDKLGIEGFGKRRSTGKGQFKIIDNLEEVDLPQADKPNYFMTLSNYVPSEPKEGYYNLDVKRGKLGSVYAAQKNLSPWKTPFVFYKPGSVFKITDNNKYYGGLLKNIHAQRKEIVQYGYAFDIEVRIDE